LVNTPDPRVCFKKDARLDKPAVRYRTNKYRRGVIITLKDGT